MDYPSLNEEELKAQVLLPYLNSLGISCDQIELEKTLHLRLGRQTVVHGGSGSKAVRGRLDVLVRSSSGQNLFVLELKRPDSDLTDDDRDQGISYARLLDQIAPFVLVTNGRDNRLYDTVTKALLDNQQFPKNSEFWRNDGFLADAESLRIRFEALKLFVSYSVDNVRKFSQAQQAEWLDAVRGDRWRSDRKYIPELYIRRQAVRDAIDRFLAGTGVAFAIVGESGVGKTNEMCALAERLSSDRIALFLSSTALSNGLGETLRDEFNWHFSDAVTEPELVKRLAEIARATEKSVVILVDALDEASVPGFEQSVSEFARHLKSCAGQVRLVVAAKSAEWERFSRFRGTPSHLALTLDTRWDQDLDNRQEGRPLVLTEFSEEELSRAERKYRSVFNLANKLRGRMRAHCRLPFFLRVASETYSDRSEGLPTDISESQLVQAWLDGKYAAMVNPERARLELLSVARAAHARAVAPDEGGFRTLAEIEMIPEVDILVKTGNASGPIGDELLAHGVLKRHVDVEGRVSFSFYYSPVRDYLLARHVLRLDQKSSAEFGTLADDLLSSHILQGALSWHLRDAPRGHLDELKKTISGRAAVFVETYNRVLDEVVPGTKAGVEPYTTGPIGFAYEVMNGIPRSYGFYAIRGTDVARVTPIEPTNDELGPWPFSRQLWELKVHQRAGWKNFSNSDPLTAAADFAYKQIKGAIAEGRLDDTVSQELLVEAALALAIAYKGRLRLQYRGHLSLLDPSFYPADIESIDRSLQEYFGFMHYQRQWADEQQAQRTKYFTRLSGSATSVRFEPQAMDKIKERVRGEVERDIRFPKPNVVGEKEFHRLPHLLERLLQDGIAVVNSPLLPAPDLRVPYRDDEFSNGYSDEQMARFIQEFFVRGLAAYKAIAEQNFPGICDRFETYARLPLTAIVEYRRPQETNRGNDWGGIMYAFRSAESARGEFEVRVDPAERTFDLTREARPHYSDYKGRPLEFGLHSTSLRNLLHPLAPGFWAHQSHAGSLATVRGFAYDLLKRDLDSLCPVDLLNAMRSHD